LNPTSGHVPGMRETVSRFEIGMGMAMLDGHASDHHYDAAQDEEDTVGRI